MRKILSALGMIFLLSFPLGLIGHDPGYKVEEKEEIQKTLKFEDPSQPKELLVDNIFGSIKAEGYDGPDVQLVVHKTIKARTKDRIQKAKEEVELVITEEKNAIDLYVDGPFRNSHKNRSWRDPGYAVHYDFELKVPHKTNLCLKTVTEGNITVKNIEGEFEVQNVNGWIEMTDVAGAGTAHTVNGRVEVHFTRNPQSDCSFRTINGDIEVSFLDNLSADFRLKTFSGDAYSDFPMTYLPRQAAEVKRDKGKYLYKSDRSVGIRVQKGGPKIEMDTMNGDLIISKKK
ncbi:MAG: DUF4097 domain-containing protein [Candidatus Aminicenantes bacterium]|nr:DUF4097 domain-containing protein [Candidatus Aminicenantes bacterium]